MSTPHTPDPIEILVDGFMDNPVFAWAFPDEASRPEALRGWFRFWQATYGAQGNLEIARSGAGAALWARPEAEALGADALGPLIELVQRYNGDRTGIVLAGFGALTPPSEPHWYLHSIAARRGRRARGIGAELLEAGLDEADRAGIPVYLESSNPRNLSFYDRYGFLEQAPRIDLPEAGPPLQPLIRPVGG